MISVKLRDMSIKQKLIVIIMLTSAVILFLSLLIFIVWEQIDSRQRLISDLKIHADIIGDNYKTALVCSDEDCAERTLSILTEQKSIIFACIYDKQGQILAQYQRKDIPEKIQPPQPQEEGHFFDENGLSIFREINFNGEMIGTIYLQDNMCEIYCRLKCDSIIAGVILSIVLIVAYFLSSNLQKVISRPIKNLAEVAKDISKKNDYSVRVPQESNDEIGRLVFAFNKMLEQIQCHDSKLVEAKENLEIKVRARTSELTAINKKLMQEVTEHKKTLTEHKESQERYKTLFENSREAIVTIEPPTWKFCSANSSAVEMYGAKSKEELFQYGPWEVSPEKQFDGQDTAEKAPYIINKTLQEGSQFFEWAHKRLNGEEFPSNIMLTRVELGGRTILLATIRDITEAKRTEQALQEWKNRYEAAIVASGNILFDWDLQTNEVTYGGDTNKILGYSIEEMKGGFEQFQQLVHPEDRDDFDNGLEYFIERKIFTRMEFRIRRKDGEYIFLEGEGHFAADSTGELNRMTGFLRDITDRKQAEQAIQELKNRYEAAILASENILYDWDSQTHEVTYGGDLDNILGYTKEEMEGGLDRWMELIHPDDLNYFKNTIKRLIETKESVHLEFRVRRKDGEYIYVEDTGHFIANSEGEMVRMLGFIRDITDRKRAEEKLRDEKERADLMAREAQEANQAKSRFLANMSHEIRTPMNGILGMIDLTLDERLTDKVSNYLKTARSSGNALLEIINDILDISKIESGKIEITHEEFSLNDLLFNINNLLHPNIAEKGIEFKIVFDNPVPEKIYSDSMRLRQCLFNLIGNAAKFTREGHIYLRLSLDEVDNTAFIRFDVEDTGIGIPGEKQEEIFDMFVQADNRVAREYGGTGLGLAITRKLTELLGGTLTITSEFGKGSVFSLVIPIGVDKDSQELITKIEGSTVCQWSDISDVKLSGRILIAEDSKVNQMLITSVLKKVGLEPILANDGKEAVEKATSESFDAILMDINMPNMNGYEATMVLREKGYTLPIIALTASVMKADMEKCLKVGCDEHLCKPIDRLKLFETLSRYLPSGGDPVRSKIDDAKTQVDELCQTVCNSESQNKKNSGVSHSTTEENLIDWADVVSRCGDEEQAKEIVEAFFVDNPAYMKDLSEAIEAGDAEKVRSLSHMLKGSGAAIGAKPFSKAAYNLELPAKEGKLEDAESLYADVQDEFEKLRSLVLGDDWIELVRNK